MGETDGQKFPSQEIFGEGGGTEKRLEKRLEKWIGETVGVNGETAFLGVVLRRLYVALQLVSLGGEMVGETV